MVEAAGPPAWPLTEAELSAWLRLLGSPGIGRESARRLLAAFGSPEAVMGAGDAARRTVVGRAAAAGLLTVPSGHAEQLAATCAWLLAAGDRRVMVLGETDYPLQLLNTADPPLLLYLEGSLKALGAPSVAVVGSRRPTPQGRDNARQFAQGLASQGWAVVSGLAAGIDAAAHEGALQAGAGGAGTVAVVGTGIDRVYPPSHAPLARRLLAQGGLIVSELPLGAPPLGAHFPQRNRIIAGLTRGTLVVEAALRSGSLITARMALEAGREVMVVPGSILADQTAGCHELIRQGATLVVSVAQVLESLGDRAPAAPTPIRAGGVTPQAFAKRDQPEPSPTQAPAAGGAPTPDDPVLQALGHDPTSLDALIARCGWPAPALSAHLLTLELAGQVARLPGGLYQRVGSA